MKTDSRANDCQLNSQVQVEIAEAFTTNASAAQPRRARVFAIPFYVALSAPNKEATSEAATDYRQVSSEADRGYRGVGRSERPAQIFDQPRLPAFIAATMSSVAQPSASYSY
jgi:hypothetical protein